MKIWTQGIAHIDGKFVGLEEAAIPVMDSGFLMGLNIYDSVSLYNGYLFRPEAALQRFLRSAKHVKFDLTHNDKTLSDLVFEVARKSELREGVINVIATRGVRQPDRPVEKWRANLIVIAVPPLIVLSKEQREKGIRLKISAIRNIPAQCLEPRIKNYNRLYSYIATVEAHDAGLDDAILLGIDGAVTEGPSYNIFIVADGKLVTPLSGVLEGITRDTVVKISKHLGLAVEQRQIYPYDLYNAEEVFACSTLRGAIGVVEVDSRAIGNGLPGSITTAINSTYWDWHTRPPHGVCVVG
ncbi:MAG: aminotransferase class IV [Taibaiella sp.]|nr:aminotransferase class IV [Taibaiella sp.]